MLTRIKRVNKRSVTVASQDLRVTVTVDRGSAGFPKGPLTRREAHEALTKVEETTHDFLAAVESDVHATSSND